MSDPDTTPTNPYATPCATLAEEAGIEYARINPFDPRGRLGRLRYLGYSLSFGLLLQALALSVGWGSQALQQRSWVEPVMAVLALISLAVGLVLSIQRLHDMNRRAWWVLLMLVPLVNVLLTAVLLLVPGSRTANRYGARPPPNPTYLVVTVLVACLLVLMLLGSTLVIDLRFTSWSR